MGAFGVGDRVRRPGGQDAASEDRKLSAEPLARTRVGICMATIMYDED